jgi:hypothetical protein
MLIPPGSIVDARERIPPFSKEKPVLKYPLGNLKTGIYPVIPL